MSTPEYNRLFFGPSFIPPSSFMKSRLLDVLKGDPNTDTKADNGLTKNNKKLKIQAKRGRTQNTEIQETKAKGKIRTRKIPQGTNSCNGKMEQGDNQNRTEKTTDT